MKVLLLIAVYTLFPVGSAIADNVYKWVDKNGKVHFSDVPQDREAEKIEIDEPNLADPVEITQRPSRPRERERENFRENQLSPTRQELLEKEQADNEKCLRYYGLPCKAVSHIQKQNNLRQNASSGLPTGGRPINSADRNRSRSSRY